MPARRARTAWRKAPVSKGEQGQEQFARAADYTKKNQAAKTRGSEVCNAH